MFEFVLCAGVCVSVRVRGRERVMVSVGVRVEGRVRVRSGTVWCDTAFRRVHSGDGRI